MDIWKKLERAAIYLGLATIAAYLCLFIWLIIEFKHPYICEYRYIAADGTEGTSKMCSVGSSGSDYCRIDAKTNIAVKSFKEVCGRR